MNPSSPLSASPDSTHPALSVIVPVLNEREALPLLLHNLALQEGALFEVIVSDGGSDDGTPQAVAEAAATLPFRTRVISAPQGRERQLNAGAAAGSGPRLLFLHADSLFPDRHALQRGILTLDSRRREAGHDRIAGRFCLRFRRACDGPSPAYAFYEAKARLERKGCIHGDQGFMLSRTFFEEAGSFPSAPSMLTETGLADRILACGEWLLFPDEILTSARRFETEGLRERQTLNALIMGAAAAGWDRFFAEVPRLYRQQSLSGRLRLGPILAGIDGLLTELPATERRRLWRAVGAFVRDNAWQVPFFFDVRAGLRHDPEERHPAMPLTAWYERRLAPLLAGATGAYLASTLTRLWLRRLLRRETAVTRTVTSSEMNRQTTATGGEK